MKYESFFNSATSCLSPSTTKVDPLLSSGRETLSKQRREMIVCPCEYIFFYSQTGCWLETSV